MLEDGRKLVAIGIFRNAGWRDGTIANFFAGARGGQKHRQCLKPESWGRKPSCIGAYAFLLNDSNAIVVDVWQA